MNTTAATGVTRTITVTNAGATLNLSGTVASSGGPTGFTKAGTGLLLLSGMNTYTGPTILSTASTVRANSTQAFGINSAVTLSIAGATLDLNGFNTTLGSLTGIAGSIVSLGGATLTVGTDGTTTTGFLGNFTGTAAARVNKTGLGILTLTGTNTFGVAGQVGIDLQQGGLNFPSQASLGQGDLLISGANTSLTGSLAAVSVTVPLILGNNATTVTIGNFPTAAFLGVAMTIAGPVSWNTGSGVSRTLIVDSTVLQNITGVITSSGTGNTLIKQGVGTLAITGANAATLNLAGSQAIQAQNGTLQINSDGALGVAPTTIVSDNILLNGGTLGSVTSAVVLNMNRGVLLGSNGGTFDAPAVASPITILGAIGGSGSGNLTKTGIGALTLSGGNSYTGPTYITAGPLSAQSPTALGTTAGGTFVLNNAALELSSGQGAGMAIGAEALSLVGTGITNAGAFRNTAGFNSFAGDITISGGLTGARINSDAGFLRVTGNINSTTSTSLLLGGAGSMSLTGTIGSGVLNPVGNSVIKDGAGAAYLVGANTYAGFTAVNAGVLRVQNSSALGTAAGATFVANLAALELDGSTTNGDLTIADPIGINGTGILATGALRSIAGNNTLSGTVSLGTDSRISTEAGTLTLTGGINGSGFGVTIGGSGNTTITTAGISGAGTSLTKTDFGVLTLAAAGSYTGATTITGGMVLLLNDLALGTAAGGTTVGNGASLVLQGGRNIVGEALTLNGNGSVANQSGALVGTSGTNSYGGLITLGSAATISADGASVLNVTNTGIITGATFALTLGGSGTGNLASVVGNTTGGIIKTGTGTWTLTGASTYTGGTTVNAGTLTVDLATGSLANAAGSTLSLGGGTFNILGTGIPTSLNLGNATTSLVLAAGTNSGIAIDSNGASATNLLLGATWLRGAQATLSIDYTAANSLSRVVVGSAPAGATGTNKILAYVQVRDGGGIGLGSVNGSNQIVRFDSTTATTLADNSNDLDVDYTTLNMASNPLAWSNAITTRSVNSLTFDTTAGPQSVNMGAVANALTITSGALQFLGSSNGTLLGGRITLGSSELIVQQNGTGLFQIDSSIGGTGSLLKLGTGTLRLSGGGTAIGGVLNATTTVTGISTTAGLIVGQSVSGNGIPTGTTIASILSGTSLTLSNAASDSLTSSLTFGSVNTYLGPTTINQGTLQAGASSLFSAPVGGGNFAIYGYSGGPFGVNSAVSLANTSGATLDIAGYNVVIGTLNGGGAAGGNVLLGNGGTLTIGGGNLINNFGGRTFSTYGGQISGAGNLTISGGGSYYFTNNTSDYTGQTNINAGTAVLTGSNGLGAGTTPIFVNGGNGIMVPGGTLVVQGGLGATGITFDRSIALSGRGNSFSSAVNVGGMVIVHGPVFDWACAMVAHRP